MCAHHPLRAHKTLAERILREADVEIEFARLMGKSLGDDAPAVSIRRLGNRTWRKGQRTRGRFKGDNPTGRTLLKDGNGHQSEVGADIEIESPRSHQFPQPLNDFQLINSLLTNDIKNSRALGEANLRAQIRKPAGKTRTGTVEPSLNAVLEGHPSMALDGSTRKSRSNTPRLTAGYGACPVPAVRGPTFKFTRSSRSPQNSPALR